MAEIDGLGQVYQKQGNTGAATWETPIEQGNTPFAYMAEDLGRKNLLDYQYNIAAKKAAEKQKADELAKAFDDTLDNKAWEVDVPRELMADAMDWKQSLAQLKIDSEKEGFNPNDITHPKVAAVKQKEALVKNKYDTSNQQKADYNKFVTLIAQDQNSKEPQFDTKASLDALNAWRDTPKVLERAKVNPAELLVPKAKVLDMYRPINDLPIKNYVASNLRENDKEKKTYTTLNEANLKKDIDAIVKNPIYEEDFQEGVKQNFWGSKAEWSKALFDKKKLEFTQDYGKVIKPQDKSFTYESIYSGGSASDVLKNMGAGTQTPNIISLATDGTKGADGKPIKKSFKGEALNAMTLGNINATISGGTAIESSTGKPLEGTDAYTLVSGTMSTPFTYNDGRVVPLTSGEFKFYDKSTGKTKTYTGTKEEIKKQMISDGVGKYTSKIEGVAVGPDDKKITVWVDSDKVIQGPAKKTDPLKGAQAAYVAQQRWIEEQNAGYGAGKSTTTTTVIPKGRVR